MRCQRAGDVWRAIAVAVVAITVTSAPVAVHGNYTAAVRVSPRPPLGYGADSVLGGVRGETAPTVTSLSPDYGPMTGGTLVTVNGTGFVPGANASCFFDGLIYAFNGITVPATVKSPTQLTCVAPAILCESPTYLEVSMGDGVYSSSQMQYSYIQYFSAAAGLLPYTDEATGHVIVQVAPQVDASALTVTVTLGTTTLLRAPVTANGQLQRLAFPLKLVPLGQNMSVTASLTGIAGAGVRPDGVLPGTTITINRTFPLFKLAPNPLTVSVDRWTRGIRVGGAPFLAMGWFTNFAADEPEVFINTIQVLSAMGFNHMMPYNTKVYVNAANPGGLLDVKRILDAAAWCGMRVQLSLDWVYDIVTGTGPLSNFTTEVGFIKQVVTAFKDHPAILGWYITDDTVIFPQDRVAMCYTLVKQLDPYHPIFNTFAGSGQAWSYLVPQVGYDVPQYEMYSFQDPSYQSTTIATTYPMNFVPGFICGQGHEGPYSTRAALRAQAYVTFMFSGTSMILWEYWIWRAPTYDQQLTFEAAIMTAEFSDLLPSIFTTDHDAPSVAISSPDWVAAKAWREAGGCINIAVANMRIQPSTFTLSSDVLALAVNDSVPVLWEQRNTTLVLGNISEPIDSYGRHVYRLNCSFAANTFAEPVAEKYSRDHAVSGPNMVANPSFEDKVLPSVPGSQYRHEPMWSAILAVGYAVFNPTYFTDTSTTVHGRNSLRIVAVQGSSATIVRVPLVGDAAKGGTFAFSAWVRPPVAAGSDGTVTVALTTDQGATPLTSRAFAATDGYQWAQLTWQGAFTSAGGLQIKFAGAGVLWLDQVEVYAVA